MKKYRMLRKGTFIKERDELLYFNNMWDFARATIGMRVGQIGAIGKYRRPVLKRNRPRRTTRRSNANK
jgi:hypothetical protein